LRGRAHVPVREQRLQPFVEIFNLPNFSTVSTVNETIGTHYFVARDHRPGPPAQFGAQIDW